MHTRGRPCLQRVRGTTEAEADSAVLRAVGEVLGH